MRVQFLVIGGLFAVVLAALSGCTKPCDTGFGKTADGECLPLAGTGDGGSTDTATNGDGGGDAGTDGGGDAGTYDGGGDAGTDGGGDAGTDGGGDAGTYDGGSDGGADGGADAGTGTKPELAGFTGQVTIASGIDTTGATQVVVEAWAPEFLIEGWPDPTNMPASIAVADMPAEGAAASYELYFDFDLTKGGQPFYPFAFIDTGDGNYYDNPRGVYASGAVTVMPLHTTPGVDLVIDTE